MKCPKQNCKGELKAKRTLAEGREVRRQRFCPVCGARPWTVELFSEDLKTLKSQYEKEIQELHQELQNERREKEEIYRKDTKAKEAILGWLFGEERRNDDN